MELKAGRGPQVLKNTLPSPLGKKKELTTTDNKTPCPSECFRLYCVTG